MDSIKECFQNIKSGDLYRRVDEAHVLDLYIGLDNMSRYTLFLITDSEPFNIYSSQIINVQIGLRKDKRWTLSFSLVNNRFEDVFCHFCEDIIDSSRTLETSEKGAEFICTRYTKWQSMLSKYNGEILSDAVIKGLIGELYFLLHYLTPMYGEQEAVNAWIGPEKADQDFVINNIWYEVKTTVSGAESVRISSLEQLDTQMPGNLVVVYLDKTSYADEHRITLNSIFNDVLLALPTDATKQKLRDILLNFGYYPRREYDEHIFKFSKMQRYRVDDTFPAMRRKQLPISVVNAKYTLSLSLIAEYLLED